MEDEDNDCERVDIAASYDPTILIGRVFASRRMYHRPGLVVEGESTRLVQEDKNGQKPSRTRKTQAQTPSFHQKRAFPSKVVLFATVAE